jgi:nucleotide-binding universal stress UspA family protein
VKKDLESRSDKYALAAPGHILVATDLTDMAYLMPYVVAQAEATGARISLVHAISPSEFVANDPAVIPYIDRAKVIRDVQLMLLDMAQQIEARGISCDTIVREGLASDVIREELGKTAAGRLILGTHGRGKLGRLAVGSIAQQVISSVNVPVFLVGRHAREAIEHVIPRKILHAVSLTGNYQESLDLALALGQTHGAEVTLLHVLEPDLANEINPERTMDWAKHALRELAPGGLNLVPPVHTLVTKGLLAEEILKVADQTDADWILLGADGTHRSWPFRESAAYQVLRRATCPVVTLRHEPDRVMPVKLEEVHFTSPL